MVMCRVNVYDNYINAYITCLLLNHIIITRVSKNFSSQLAIIGFCPLALNVTTFRLRLLDSIVTFNLAIQRLHSGHYHAWSGDFFFFFGGGGHIYLLKMVHKQPMYVLNAVPLLTYAGMKHSQLLRCELFLCGRSRDSVETPATMES